MHTHSWYILKDLNINIARPISVYVWYQIKINKEVIIAVCQFDAMYYKRLQATKQYQNIIVYAGSNLQLPCSKDNISYWIW